MFDMFYLRPITNSYYLFSFPGDIQTGRNYAKAATAKNVNGPPSALIIVIVILLMYFSIIAGPFYSSYSYGPYENDYVYFGQDETFPRYSQNHKNFTSYYRTKYFYTVKYGFNIISILYTLL